eukprot:COSAG06_NODE_518_length_14769_cov_75.390048_10_plen_72_part_00
MSRDCFVATAPAWTVAARKRHSLRCEENGLFLGLIFLSTEKHTIICQDRLGTYKGKLNKNNTCRFVLFLFW